MMHIWFKLSPNTIIDFEGKMSTYTFILKTLEESQTNIQSFLFRYLAHRIQQLILKLGIQKTIMTNLSILLVEFQVWGSKIRYIFA